MIVPPEFVRKLVLLPFVIYFAIVPKIIGQKYAELLMKLLVFTSGGGLGLIIKLSVTYMLASGFGLWQMLAYSLGLVLNIIFNFLFHRHITFGETTDWKRRLALFTVVTLIVVALDWALVYAFAENLGFNIYVVAVPVTIMLSIANFVLNKLFVFQENVGKSL
jgi:putative flippase GtrA